jgi:multicomponent Na+:H+ antiporter subunit F
LTQPIVAWASVVAQGMLAAAVLLSVYRLVRGPSLPDRVVALDLMAVSTVGIIGVATIRSENIVYLDVAVVLALIAFMGTVAFARYLERRIRS